jgi:NAD-dependent deacetylase sirtuin 2
MTSAATVSNITQITIIPNLYTKDNDNKDKNRIDKKHDSNDGDDEEVDEDDDADESTHDDDQKQELLQKLMAIAEERGIPLEWLILQANQLTGDDSDDNEDDEPIVYPFDKFPTSIDDVSKFILSDQCQKILVLAGAGMSVASGIPDFRSADGLYATLNPHLLSADDDEKEAIRLDPTISLDHHMFLQNPLPCLELQREFILGTQEQRWKATLAHRFIELLHTKTKKLVRHYTQNIDGLEDQCTHLPTDKVIAVHGSMDRAECAQCHTESDFQDFCSKVRAQIKDLSGKDPLAPKVSTPIECKVCGFTSMKPAIVLFRSSLPKEFALNVPNDIKDVDLLIVIGTSLRVAPANSIVRQVPKSAMRVLVNREEAGGHLGMNFDGDDPTRDYFAQGECDAIFLELMDSLGWIDDLEHLLPNQLLPDSSAALLQEYLKQRNDRKNVAAS